MTSLVTVNRRSGGARLFMKLDERERAARLRDVELEPGPPGLRQAEFRGELEREPLPGSGI